MRTTKTFKIYGAEGHRQKESFNESHNIWIPEKALLIDVYNSDRTGTNEYTLLEISAPTEDIIFDALDGQLSDGIFENCKVGYVVEIGND